MNRRGFFRTLAAATAGFSILPPATTYQRIWKAVAMPKINPEWVKATYEMRGVVFDPREFWGEWRFISDSEDVGNLNTPFNNIVITTQSLCLKRS